MFIKEFNTIDGKYSILFYVNNRGPGDCNFVGFVDLDCEVIEVGKEVAITIHWLDNVNLVDILPCVCNPEMATPFEYSQYDDKHYAVFKFIMPASNIQIGLFINKGKVIINGEPV